jgi:hypothetical protein
MLLTVSYLDRVSVNLRESVALHHVFYALYFRDYLKQVYLELVLERLLEILWYPK